MFLIFFKKIFNLFIYNKYIFYKKICIYSLPLPHQVFSLLYVLYIISFNLEEIVCTFISIEFMLP